MKTDVRDLCYDGYMHDDKSLYFGNSKDVGIQWDGTNLIVSSLADDGLIEIGDSATTQLSFDLKWYANEASGASYLYFDASANLIYTTGIDFQIKDDDFLVFGTGAGATGDVKIEWDTTGTDALRITATADDTPIEFGNGTNSFDITIFGNVAGDYLLWDASDSKLEAFGAVNFEFGVSGTPLVKDTADTKFIGIYTDCGAATGDSRAIYVRHYITSTGSGEALRAFQTVSAANAATGGTINGAHISLDIDASASISGQANAARFTLGANDDTKTLNTNVNCIMLESDLGTGITPGALNSFIRFSDYTAQRIQNLFRVPTVANGTIFAAHTTQTLTHSLKIVSDAGTAYYIMCTDAATNRS